MEPTTLGNTFSKSSDATAIIVPSRPALVVSYQKLALDVEAFQLKLAQLGIGPQAAVSIALPNSYEFIVAFIAASWQRAIAAPLNPAYKQSEFECECSILQHGLQKLIRACSLHRRSELCCCGCT